ncbi:MAG: hypothetical protein ACREPL_15665 [Rhodanobacteraceae bacterium]
MAMPSVNGVRVTLETASAQVIRKWLIATMRIEACSGTVRDYAVVEELLQALAQAAFARDEPEPQS